MTGVGPGRVVRVLWRKLGVHLPRLRQGGPRLVGPAERQLGTAEVQQVGGEPPVPLGYLLPVGGDHLVECFHCGGRLPLLDPDLGQEGASE